MTTYILYILFGLLGILTIGAFSNKEFFCKFLFINTASNIVIAILAVLASLKSRESYIDIALIYALLNFIATQGYLKYFIKINDKMIKHDHNLGL